MVLSPAALSRSTAALIEEAHWNSCPRAPISIAIVASGHLLDTKITVPVCLFALHGSPKLLDSSYAVGPPIGRKPP